MLISDGPLERLINGSRQMKSDKCLLINRVNGVGSNRIHSANSEAQVRAVENMIIEIWPEAKDQVETTLSNDWGQSYAQGAYAHYAPGQMSAYAKTIPKPVDRIHFAGEHTELVAPGMEGALTSGKRAATEVLQQPH